jgi:predicted nucleic acid-binding protein
MPPVLIDTNLLIYIFDQNEPLKQAKARRVLKELTATKRGQLSVQNLAEFLNAAVRKLSPPMTIEQALKNASHFNSIWHVYDLTPLVVLEAGRGVRDYKLSYYDAQIWATARLNQVPVVFSEDFNDGQILEGVRFVNPFGHDFVLEDWV